MTARCAPNPTTAEPVAVEAPVPAAPQTTTTEELAPTVTPPASAAEPDLAQDEPEIEPEDFVQGFCLDDVYAKYLLKKYEAEHPHHRARDEFTVRSKRRHHVALKIEGEYDVDALSYARDRLSGPTAPYYGAIPVVVNDRVDFWVQYFKTSGRRMFMKWLVRGAALQSMVQPILEASGVPNEFFYLAMIESGFNNGALSRARASGTWQFMRGTAQLYGLRVDHWVDERRDPIKSTLAAATFLRDLYADLGDWHLAMAAYNAGPGKVRKAIRLGGSHDFWSLADTKLLAKETKHYVPKVLAAILIAADPKAHGFDVQGAVADAIPDTEVLVKRPVRLEELANRLGVSQTALLTWNPELIRGITPPTKGGYALRLPPAYAASYPSIEDQLAVIQVTDIQMHTVRKGETLSRIARKYNVRVKQILGVNPALSATKLKPGRTIAIPVPGVVTTSETTKGRKVL
jgi:membrane-bound lytic murein transglycosylase D